MRRATVVLSVCLVAVGVLSAAIVAWMVASDSRSAPAWLFSHTAGAGAFQKEDGGNYTLTLTDIDPHVVAFTDRPDRDAEILDVRDLVAAWPRLFADSPPNAVLVEHLIDGQSDSIVVELSDPVLATSGLTFTAVPLTGPVPDSLKRLVGSVHNEPPATFGDVTVFIDDATASPECASQASGDVSPVECQILERLGYTLQSG